MSKYEQAENALKRICAKYAVDYKFPDKAEAFTTLAIEIWKRGGKTPIDAATDALQQMKLPPFDK